MDWPTIIIAAIIAALFALVVFFQIRNKKKGKHSCSCGGCSGCAMSDVCHANKDKQTQ